MVVDNEPLQREAWAEFDEARRRQEKASRDLHRHEQVDVPAYEKWLHRTFPTLITKLRNLHEEVATKARQVESVQAMASLTGRSPKKLWREQKEYEANPEAFEQRFDQENGSEDEDRRRRPDDEDFFGNRRSAGDSWQDYRRSFETEDSQPRRAPSEEAKAIYRRLVQRLHPDRGGEFTPVRKRLWHDVQQAWATRDTDWLARIEIEWETANDVLTQKSALSRLRRAIDELHAARRDLERKLRDYRSSTQWRFTLSVKKRATLQERLESNFEHDISFLERQLAYLNATITAWESVRSPRQRHRESVW